MTGELKQRVTARGLFKWGIALLAVTIVSRLVLTDALIAANDYLTPTTTRLGFIFAIVGLISRLSLALGAGLVSAGFVLQGLTSSRQAHATRFGTNEATVGEQSDTDNDDEP